MSLPELEIREIDFPALFKAAGILAGSRNWHDYQAGKRLLVDLDPDEYERGIQVLTKYLCL